MIEMPIPSPVKRRVPEGAGMFRYETVITMPPTPMDDFAGRTAKKTIFDLLSEHPAIVANSGHMPNCIAVVYDGERWAMQATISRYEGEGK